MANYYGFGRTNYFRVKDMDVFLNDMSEYSDIEAHKHPSDEGLVCILVTDDDGYGGFPSYDYEKDKEIDFFSIVAGHLADDEVAVFQHVGAEKLRYLTGYSMAVTNDDTGTPQFISVNIDDIYRRVAEEWNLPNVTTATY